MAEPGTAVCGRGAPSFGLVVMFPFILRSGISAYRPHRVAGQFMRGGVHALGLCLWFIAVPSALQWVMFVLCGVLGSVSGEERGCQRP